MNKAKVIEYLPIAAEALSNVGIVYTDSNNKEAIIKTYRSNISAFGAAVINSGFKPAVAFYAEDADNSDEKPKAGDSEEVKRSKLIRAMYYIVKYDEFKDNISALPDAKTIAKNVIKENDFSACNVLHEEFINASIALKLAMNTFVLTKPKKG